MHRDIRACASKSPKRCLPWLVALQMTVIGLFAAPAGAQIVPPGAPIPAGAATPVAVPTVAPAPSATAAAPLPEIPGGVATPLPEPDNGRIRLSADQLTYYSNVVEIKGEGNVDVRLDDGTEIRGNFFAMNLVANRFLVAGNVRVTYAGGQVNGAAYSSYLDFSRTYFVPVLSEPDRWTFFGHDYANPHPGREMPGDTFFLPNLDHQHIFLFAKHAYIAPRRFARFSGGVRLSTTGAFVPVPAYVLSFAPNPNFAQNSLAGAYTDAPLNFAGGDRSLETLHLRYDPANKVYLAFEEHLVGTRGSAVFSMNPITRPQKQYNILASTAISPDMSIGSFAQESTFQYGVSRPLSASAFVSIGATIGLRHSFLGIGTNNFYESLLAQPALHPGYGGQLFYGDVAHFWNPDHPFFGGVGWNGFDTKIPQLPGCTTGCAVASAKRTTSTAKPTSAASSIPRCGTTTPA